LLDSLLQEIIFNMNNLDEKYVKLLQRSYEKYKDISVLEISNKDKNANDDYRSDIVSDLGCKQGNVEINAKSKVSKSSDGKNKGIKMRHMKTFDRITFTPDEDKILLDAIQKGTHKNYMQLAKQMNRKSHSVRERVLKLQRSATDKKDKKKSFTMTEDLAIIDVAMEFIILSESFEVPLPKFQAVATDLKRVTNSVYKRWNLNLKIWIKQYYHKTLNLEIRPMLANLIAKNYKNFDEIDWKEVIQHSEFLGHTEFSLSSIYFSCIIESTTRHLRKTKNQLTLKEIAEHASEFYKNAKIAEHKKIRQTQVISHFENLVKERKLTLRFQDL